MTRCKFSCGSVTKRRSHVWSNDNKSSMEFTYEYEFSVVISGSKENKEFFASTPGGNIKLTALREDLFIPGEEYYLDFSSAPKAE